MKILKLFISVSVILMIYFAGIGLGYATEGVSDEAGTISSRGILYVLYSGDNGYPPCVKIFDNINSSTSIVSREARVISGKATCLRNPYDSICIDKANDELYIGDAIGACILVFSNASTIEGNVAPARNISGEATLINTPTGIAVDPSNNYVYVADFYDDEIYAFGRTQDGNVAPLRKIAGDNTKVFGPMSLSYDQANDRLYVANSAADSILVFDNASTINGDVAPSRVINHETYVTGPTSVSVDTSRDILYVSMRSTQEVCIWENASTINGSVAPNRQIKGSNTKNDTPLCIAVDPVNDRLYEDNDIMSSKPQRIGIWYNASKVNGNIAPSKVVSDEAAGNKAATAGIAID